MSTESYGQPVAQPEPYGQASQPGYAPQGYPQQPVFVQTPPSNGVGIAGFVTGLLGLILFWVPWLGLLLAVVGIALSGVGIAQGKKKGAPTGLSIAGLVCGIIALIPAVIVVVALVSVASSLPTY